MSVTVLNPVSQPVPVVLESGTVSVDNFPATQTVTGTVGVLGSVTVSNAVSSPVPVSIVAGGVPSTVAVNNFPSVQAVSGLVNVGNFQNPWPVTGSINVGNFPAIQNVSGTVGVSGSVSVNNLSTSPIPVAIVSGGGGSSTVSVSNFPSTQSVSGTVSVSNFPTTQDQTIARSYSAGNFPVCHCSLQKFNLHNGVSPYFHTVLITAAATPSANTIARVRLWVRIDGTGQNNSCNVFGVVALQQSDTVPFGLFGSLGSTTTWVGYDSGANKNEVAFPFMTTVSSTLAPVFYDSAIKDIYLSSNTALYCSVWLKFDNNSNAADVFFGVEIY